MECIMKFVVMKRPCMHISNAMRSKTFKRNCATKVLPKESSVHPYKRIHPWKSLKDFSNDLLKNLIYNKDGLVAINKPYGITAVKRKDFFTTVPYHKDYCISDALPHICQELGYSHLNVVKIPEKYMTGLTLLAKNRSIEDDVETALRRSNNFANTFWVCTDRVPDRKSGREHLAMRSIYDKQSSQGAVTIITDWSMRDQKTRKIKILNIDFKVLSTSTKNLSSLIEVTSSTMRNHAIRLFAATFLYTPVLGDELFSSRIKRLGDKYVNVSPFNETSRLPAQLNQDILKLLNIKPREQSIIPAHIHLRSTVLRSFLGKDKHLTIEAPLPSPFDWTCKQLDLTY